MTLHPPAGLSALCRPAAGWPRGPGRRPPEGGGQKSDDAAAKSEKAKSGSDSETTEPATCTVKKGPFKIESASKADSSRKRPSRSPCG